MKTKTSNLDQPTIVGNGNWSSDRETHPTSLKQWRQKLGYCSMLAAVPAVLASNLATTHADEVKRPQASVAGRRLTFLERLNMSSSKAALLKRQSKFLLPHQKGSVGNSVTLGGNDDCPGRAIQPGNYTVASPYTDSGNTTGANNTVNELYSYYYYSYNAAGPDHLYSFTLSSRGQNPQIEVSTTSSTYRPMIYVLRGGSSGACPAGTGNFASNWLTLAYASGGTATLSRDQMNYLPLDVPLHLFVDSPSNDASGSGPYTIRMQDVTIAGEACPNSIDCAEFFVRQQYRDFLNREPDDGGLAYWTNEITRCGGDVACIHARRVAVSAAFFIEAEFQEAGYYVYRFYKASFGRQPSFAEFSSDRGRIHAGPNLEASKQAFADEWVQRPAFVAAFSTLMSNAEFVNKVFDSAGLTAATYDALRQQEILAMNGGRSRALVVRDVIEISDFKNIPDPNNPRYDEIKQVSQYNPAFVLMQYFGYLGRDVDPGGYSFWLNVLNNREPNNYVGMVCSFITSREYQLRFGSVVTRTNSDCGQ